jgi:hypothetical protein
LEEYAAEADVGRVGHEDELPVWTAMTQCDEVVHGVDQLLRVGRRDAVVDDAFACDGCGGPLADVLVHALQRLLDVAEAPLEVGNVA